MQVRTNTLVKGSVVEVDATPFKEAYEKKYQLSLPAKGETSAAAGKVLETKTADGKEVSQSTKEKFAKRRKDVSVDPKIIEGFQSGRVLALIASRPGQAGRADGYILEGPELEFYQKRLASRKAAK